MSKQTSKIPVIQVILAYKRTSLANDRTLLSFIHVFLALLISGLGLINFFKNHQIYYYVGITLCILSPVALILGATIYIRTQKMLRRHEHTWNSEG